MRAQEKKANCRLVVTKVFKQNHRWKIPLAHWKCCVIVVLCPANCQLWGQFRILKPFGLLIFYSNSFIFLLFSLRFDHALPNEWCDIECTRDVCLGARNCIFLSIFVVFWWWSLLLCAHQFHKMLYINCVENFQYLIFQTAFNYASTTHQWREKRMKENNDKTENNEMRRKENQIKANSFIAKRTILSSFVWLSLSLSVPFCVFVISAYACINNYGVWHSFFIVWLCDKL